MTEVNTNVNATATHSTMSESQKTPVLNYDRQPLSKESLSTNSSSPQSNGQSKTHDEVNHPKHYTSHPSGVECIQVTEHMNFNIGNAVKYLWRAGEKGAQLVDLKKAAWYISREIERLGHK